MEDLGDHYDEDDVNEDIEKLKQALLNEKVDKQYHSLLPPSLRKDTLKSTFFFIFFKGLT